MKVRTNHYFEYFCDLKRSCMNKRIFSRFLSAFAAIVAGCLSAFAGTPKVQVKVFKP